MRLGAGGRYELVGRGADPGDIDAAEAGLQYLYARAVRDQLSTAVEDLQRAAEPAMYSRAAKQAEGGPLTPEAEIAVARWRLEEACAVARERDCWEEAVEAAHQVRVRVGELREGPRGYIFQDVGVPVAMVTTYMSLVGEAYAELTRRGEAAVGFQDLLRFERGVREQPEGEWEEQYRIWEEQYGEEWRRLHGEPYGGQAGERPQEEEQQEGFWLRSHGRRARSRYSARYAGYMGSAGYMGEEDEERELEEQGHAGLEDRDEYWGSGDDGGSDGEG